MGCAGGIGVRRSRRKTSRRRPGPRRNAGDQHARGWHYSVRYPIELALSSHFLRPPCPFPDGLRADDPGMTAPHCHGLALHLHRQSHELPGCTTANRVILGCAWAHEFARVVAKPHNEDPTPHQKRRTRSTRMALLSTLPFWIRYFMAFLNPTTLIYFNHKIIKTAPSLSSFKCFRDYRYRLENKDVSTSQN